MSLAEIAKQERCVGFSGADLAALMKESAQLVINIALEQRGLCVTDITSKTVTMQPATVTNFSEEKLFVTRSHVLEALSRIYRSVTPQDEQLYKELKKSIRHMK